MKLVFFVVFAVAAFAQHNFGDAGIAVGEKREVELRKLYSQNEDEVLFGSDGETMRFRFVIREYSGGPVQVAINTDLDERTGIGLATFRGVDKQVFYRPGKGVCLQVNGGEECFAAILYPDGLEFSLPLAMLGKYGNSDLAVGIITQNRVLPDKGMVRLKGPGRISLLGASIQVFQGHVRPVVLVELDDRETFASDLRVEVIVGNNNVTSEIACDRRVEAIGRTQDYPFGYLIFLPPMFVGQGTGRFAVYANLGRGPMLSVAKIGSED